MRKRVKRNQAGMMFLLPDLAGVVIFALLPFGEVVKKSFQNAVTSQWVGLKNYEEIFSNTAFRLAASNTVRFTFTCIPLLVALSLVLAATLEKLRSGKNILKSAFLLPVVVPPSPRRYMKWQRWTGQGNGNASFILQFRISSRLSIRSQ